MESGDGNEKFLKDYNLMKKNSFYIALRNEKLKIVHYTGPNRVIHELKDSPLYSKWINR